jgi:hypothetical protein
MAALFLMPKNTVTYFLFVGVRDLIFLEIREDIK